MTARAEFVGLELFEKFERLGDTLDVDLASFADYVEGIRADSERKKFKATADVAEAETCRLRVVARGLDPESPFRLDSLKADAVDRVRGLALKQAQATLVLEAVEGYLVATRDKLEGET